MPELYPTPLSKGSSLGIKKNIAYFLFEKNPGASGAKPI
jgi:hypothetical protein